MKDNYFGRQLKELRQARGMTQRALGEALGFCNQTVSFWESGRHEPDYDSLIKIAKFFEISIDELLGMK